MAAKTKKPAKENQDQVKWPFGKRNYLVFALALVVIVIGYIMLGKGSITLAPILLVLGYCILIPIALIIRDRPSADSSDELRQQLGS
jgi:hypothetical protein